jgi:MerR family transcriptional regulator, light-induced transcriptional regulator
MPMPKGFSSTGEASMLDEEGVQAARKELLDRPLAESGDHTPEGLAKALEEALLLRERSKARELLQLAHRNHDLRTVLLEVIAPVLVNIGTAWEKGYIPVSMEHQASFLLRHHVMQQLDEPDPAGPRVIVTTLPEEHHEGGALMLTVLLSRAGLHVEYLGPDTPIEDLRSFVESTKPDALVISVPTPAPLADIQPEVFRGFDSPVYFGGIGLKEADTFREQADGIFLGDDLEGFPQKLRQQL